MSFADGHHRNYRSGGLAHRTSAEIFRDTMQGKTAEIAFASELAHRRINSTVDYSVSGRGNWDISDFEIAGLKIAIKSTKHFGQLLLLEKKDWAAPSLYLPGDGTQTDSSYDAVALVRLKIDATSFIPRDAQGDEVVSRIRSALESFDWEYDIPGYIDQEFMNELFSSQEYIIKQGEVLGISTSMDADNYYCQAGELKLVTGLFETIKRAQVQL